MFCVEHETVALMQRAFNFNSASDFDRVLSGKGQESTTEAGPTDATERTVSGKGQATPTASPVARDPSIPTCDSVSIDPIMGCEELCCGGAGSTCEAYAAVINSTLSA